jgi:NADH-quinone oxidoreductase subunit E
MTVLETKYPQEIETILAKYPVDQKRAAVMPLIYLAQRNGGFVTTQDMDEIAEILGISSTDVASLVGFYTLYHSKEEGRYRIQVCTDLPCALRGAESFLDQLCDNLGIKVGETTEDGAISIEAVMCLAACDKAPMFQLQAADGISYHENQTVDTAIDLVNSLRKEPGA